MYNKSHSNKMMQKSKYFILKKTLFIYFPQILFFSRGGRESKREREKKEGDR